MKGAVGAGHMVIYHGFQARQVDLPGWLVVDLFFQGNRKTKVDALPLDVIL